MEAEEGMEDTSRALMKPDIVAAAASAAAAAVGGGCGVVLLAADRRVCTRLAGRFFFSRVQLLGAKGSRAAEGQTRRARHP